MTRKTQKLSEVLQQTVDALQTCREMADSNNDGISYKAADEALTALAQVMPDGKGGIAVGMTSSADMLYQAQACGAQVFTISKGTEVAEIVFRADAWRKFGDMQARFTTPVSSQANWKQIIDNVLSYHDKGFYDDKTAIAKLRRSVDDLTDIDETPAT